MTVILTAKSFLYDKKDDCHSESQQRGANPLSSFQNENQSSRKESHLYFEERESIRHIEVKVNHHFEETVHPSFRKDRHQSFRKDRALSFQNDSFASDSSIINLNVSFRNDRESIILK